MPKYYVSSGDISMVVDAKGPFDACLRAVRRAMERKPSVKLGLVIQASETGFHDAPLENDRFFCAHVVISDIRKGKIPEN